jgi:hypothetical protein
VRKARITMSVDEDINKVRALVFEQTGVYMTYRQLVDYMVKFYFKNQKTETAWRP